MAEHGAATPDRLALRVGDARRSYGELAARSSRLAGVFAAAGAEAGGVVAAMLPNGIEFFETAAAACRAEQYFLPVNWHLKADELAYILGDSGARVLVAHETLAEFVEPAVAAAPGCALIVVGADYEDRIAAAAPIANDRAWRSPAFMFYTSGTTGRPKGVVHSGLDAARMAMSQQGLMALWGITADDIYLLAGPAYHAGPGGYAFTALFAGGSLTILEKWDPRAALATIDAHRATYSFLTPAHFIRILEVPEEERAGYDLSSLRLVIHGGAPCPIPVKRRIIEALPTTEVWELYGASEGGATRVSPGEWLERPGTVGTPWPGVEIRLFDEGGTRVAAGAEGVIYIAPGGGAGGATFHYHRDEAKTAAAWRDGAFTVGDVGRLDADNYLYITDRVSDMVIRDGVNIYPREVEEVLHQHPAVVDCAVFGVPDDRHGEVLKAVVEVREPVTAEELQAHCRAHLADFKCPAIVDFVAELPRDPNGKVLKRHLKATPRQ
jgi:long-chain acyl-CoA synthetase